MLRSVVSSGAGRARAEANQRATIPGVACSNLNRDPCCNSKSHPPPAQAQHRGRCDTLLLERSARPQREPVWQPSLWHVGRSCAHCTHGDEARCPPGPAPALSIIIIMAWHGMASQPQSEGEAAASFRANDGDGGFLPRCRGVTIGMRRPSALHCTAPHRTAGRQHCAAAHYAVSACSCVPAMVPSVDLHRDVRLTTPPSHLAPLTPHLAPRTSHLSPLTHLVHTRSASRRPRRIPRARPLSLSLTLTRSLTLSLGRCLSSSMQVFLAAVAARPHRSCPKRIVGGLPAAVSKRQPSAPRAPIPTPQSTTCNARI